MTVCPFFGVCGGCAYQDLPHADYISLKRGFVQNALIHAGIDFSVSEIVEIGAHTRRRATFAYAGGQMGFNAKKSHTIVCITKCLVLTPELEKLIEPLRELVKHFEGSGDIAVLTTKWGADITVLPQKKAVKRFEKKKKKTPEKDVLFLQDVALFCQQNAVARFIYDGALIYQKTTLCFPPNVFMQPSEQGEQVLTDLVLKGCQNAHNVADLFCGLGTFSKPLKQAGKKVMAYDITTDSICALKQEGVDAFVRDLFRNPLTATELNDFDAAVLDPARAGAFAQCTQIAKSTLKTVVMVSCNPVTFAKDCKVLLDAGFTFSWIVPVDQFTFTEHIELVGMLERK